MSKRNTTTGLFLLEELYIMHDVRSRRVPQLGRRNRIISGSSKFRPLIVFIGVTNCRAEILDKKVRRITPALDGNRLS